MYLRGRSLPSEWAREKSPIGDILEAYSAVFLTDALCEGVFP
jgi:hypothetical protein